MSTVRNDVSARVALQPERAISGHVSVESGLLPRIEGQHEQEHEQSSGHDLDPGHDRVSVVTPQNASAGPPESAVAAAPGLIEANGDVDRAAAERSAATAHASQADLTKSVGTRLSRDGYDAELPVWRRWLTKPFSR